MVDKETSDPILSIGEDFLVDHILKLVRLERAVQTATSNSTVSILIALVPIALRLLSFFLKAIPIFATRSDNLKYF